MVVETNDIALTKTPLELCLTQDDSLDLDDEEIMECRNYLEARMSLARKRRVCPQPKHPK